MLGSQKSDKTLLINYLRSALNLRATKSNQSSNYETIRDRLLWSKTKLDQQYRSVKKPLLGQLNWTEIVGHYLLNNRIEGRETLATHLNPLFFKFNGEEYEYLCSHIRMATEINLNKGLNSSTLKDLHPDLFIKKELAESKIWLTNKLNHFLEQAELLRKSYALKQNEYSELLFKHYDQHRTAILQKLTYLKDLYTDAEIQFGSLLNTKNRQIKLKSIASKKYKDLLAAKKEISKAYQAFVAYFKQTELFDYQFPKIEELVPFNRLESITGNFETAFNLWRKDITGLIQEDMNRLGIKTAIPELNFQESIRNLEQSLNDLLADLNGSSLLSQSLENRFLVTPQQQQFLEGLIRRLRHLQGGLQDYDDFYTWNRFWLQLTENGKKVIGAIQKVDPSDWQATFESWYWHNALIKFDHTTIPTEAPNFSEFETLNQQFESLQSQQIKIQADSIRLKALQSAKKKSRANYNAIYQKSVTDSENSPYKLIEAHLTDILNAIPILLSTPNAIGQLLNLNNRFQGFEQIIVEDAHAIPTIQLEQIISWSSHVILLYDEHYASIDWMNWLEDRVDDICNLDYCYELAQGNLSVQSNKIHHTNTSILHHCEVVFKQINGRYDEEEKTNEEEAQLVLRLLNEIPENAKRMFPKVGIVCFTKAQRNLILDYIYQIKYGNLPGTERIERLLRNGLDIVSLHDLSEEHFDVIILSGTLGVVDLQDNLTKDFILLKTETTKMGLLKLMAIKRKKLFVINSLPEAFLKETFTEIQPEIFNWAAYLLMLKALSEDNNLKQSEILKNWQEVYPPGLSSTKSTYLFLSEVVLELKKYLSDDYVILENYTFQGINFPFVLEQKNKPGELIYLTGEGFLADTAYNDYKWEIRQREKLKNKGMNEIAISSLNWWRNQEVELKRVLDIIQTSVS